MTISSISTESTRNRPLGYQPADNDPSEHNDHPSNNDASLPADGQVDHYADNHADHQTSTLQPLQGPLASQSTLLPTQGAIGDHGQPQLLPQPSSPLANGQSRPPLPVQLRDGRFLEQLLLHPESIPQSDQRALRQQLQQRLSSTATSALPSEAAQRAEGYQLLATVLAGADGTPLINPQLQQQMEHKQASRVENGKPPSMVPMTVTERSNPQLTVPVIVDNAKANLPQRPALAASALAQLLLAVERGAEIDQHGLQQVARQLLSASSTSNVLAPHQTLVLVALLLDADDENAPTNKMNPRLRRQLMQRLLPLLQRQTAAETLPAASSRRQQIATATGESKQQRLQQAVRQAITASTSAVSDQAEQDQQPPLAAALLWPVLPVVPAAVSKAQINPLLGALVDKGSLPVGNNHSLSQFIGKASMEQLMMVLTTLVMKVNTNSAQSLLASQQINQKAAEAVSALQLQKQIEEAEKALEQQESAKKAGIFGAIFSWVVAAITTVVAVVTMNPVLIAAAVLLVASAAVDTAALALGDKAPECLQWISMGLSIGAGLLSGGAALFSLGRSVFKEGMKAGFKVIFKAMSQACKKLIEWLKNIPTAAKDFASNSFEILKHPKKALADAATQIKDNVVHTFKNPKSKAELLTKVSESASKVVEATGQGIETYYRYQKEMLQAALKTLENDNWLLQMILAYYQKQKNQLHQAMSDLYQQQGEAVSMASQALQESNTLQGRIAGSLV